MNQITSWGLWRTTWSTHPNISQVYFTTSRQISFFCQSRGAYTLSLRFRFLSRSRKPFQKVVFFQESFIDVKPKCESTSCLINRHHITNEFWRAIMWTSSITLHNTWKFSYIPAGMIRAVIFLSPALQCCCQPQYMTSLLLCIVCWSNHFPFFSNFWLSQWLENFFCWHNIIRQHNISFNFMNCANST